jgi:uncharacterized protein YecT (DUF1311 family)
MIRSVIITIAFAALSSTAYANSNCDHPRDDFDGLYCLNKIYLQADKDLNETYGKLSTKLDAAGRSALKQGQLDWIDSRNRQCSRHDPHGFWVNLECATGMTIDRTQFLTDRVRECVSSGCLNSRLR